MNGKVLFAAALAAALFAGCSGGGKEGRMIKTCIFPGDYPDPSIMRDGQDFYMTHSCFTYYPGLLIWHSTDLLNWEPVARAVQGQDYSIFAPELCKVGDKYYIYYPTSNGLNFVVTADDIRGPWSEPVQLDASGIDPGHVVGEDGKRYLYLSNGNAPLVMAQLTDDGLSVAAKPKTIYQGWQFPKEWETEGFWLESPKLVKHGDYYYLITAEGGTAGPETSHMCVVARSKSATGPWENSPHNPMIHTYSADEQWWSKGHGTLIDDADGNWYIVYHSYRNGFHTLGRSTIVESVVWTKDGWPVAAQKDGALWENKGLQADYSYLRDYDNPLLWAKWEPGVDGKEGFENVKDGTLMTTTAIDEDYMIEASFCMGGNGQAGLYLFYNENAFFGTTVDGVEDLAKANDDTADVYIRIENKHNVASVWASADGSDWTLVESGRDVSSYHHNTYQGFFALRPAYLVTPDSRLKSFTYKPL